jgi:hypothetical protein
VVVAGALGAVVGAAAGAGAEGAGADVLAAVGAGATAASGMVSSLAFLLQQEVSQDGQVAFTEVQSCRLKMVGWKRASIRLGRRVQ